MTEQWKKIKGYEDYMISNTGKVMRLEKKIVTSAGVKKLLPTITMKPQTGKDGYVRINIHNDNGERGFTVHRLVSTHFIPNKDNKPQVNHLDGNKSNNNQYNLEWCTAQENQQHAFEMGLNSQKGERNSRSLVTNKFVLNIKNLYRSGIKRSIIMNDYNLNKIQFDRYIYGWKHLNIESIQTYTVEKA